MIKKLKTLYTKLDVHTAEVVRKSAASTVVKVAGMLIGLGVSIFLGRTISADGLGIINLANRIVQMLIVFGLLGMNQVIIKEVAISHNRKRLSHIGNVMYTAYLLNGSITLVISVIFIFISPWLAINIFNEPRLTYPLIVALLVMTPQIFSRIFSSGLVGYRKIWQSNLVEQTLSIAVTGLILFVSVWFFHNDITIRLVALFYAFGRVIVTVSVGFYWKTLYNYKDKRINLSKQLLRTALPLLLVSAASIIMRNADVIVLGILADSKSIGLYTVAARLSLLIVFLLQIINSAVAPKIAILYKNGKITELEKMISQITKVISFIGLVPLIIFMIAGKFILGIWGTEFTEAYWILVILSIGQFVNIATGTVGVILTMTGNEKIQSKISLVSLSLYLLLMPILIKLLGVNGAAIATAIVLIGENIAKVIYVKRKVGIKPIGL
ncbi:MAG: flippase [Bacteroidetes bacterium]|nr:MAG: flippase [Bacteroidota bacterium]RLD84618.1 MAG: flippase [Bacteroidota bacterium]